LILAIPANLPDHIRAGMWLAKRVEAGQFLAKANEWIDYLRSH